MIAGNLKAFILNSFKLFPVCQNKSRTTLKALH